jgi:6-phosphofructokinase
MARDNRLAILCGGGPAPGINSVIAAATIRASLASVEVLGIRDGFKWIMQGDIDHVRPLNIEDVSNIHFDGGSIIGIARANPTKELRLLETTTRSLERLGVDKLVSIGGDDTAFSAMKLAEHSRGRLRVVHVPKTIDNDLDLPNGIATFGYQTARSVGVDIVQNLMTDAATTGKWFLILTMGRTAGHLALGIGKAAGATVIVVPEEFGPAPIRMSNVVDILAGSIIKRRAQGHADGTAVLAEGLVERMEPSDLEGFGTMLRDEHGHLRLAQFGLYPTLVAKDIGYELRCADPIPFDLEYTRDLGYCAAKFLLEGGSNAMVTLQDGHFVPIPFARMLDPNTGRTRVRPVDVNSEHYRIALRYMVRLRKDDFADEAIVARLADIAGVTPERFRDEFGYVVSNEAPPLRLPIVPVA